MGLIKKFTQGINNFNYWLTERTAARVVKRMDKKTVKDKKYCENDMCNEDHKGGKE